MGFARMPRRFLRGSLARMALTVVALACGVALVCAIDLVNRAVYAAFVEIIDTMAGRASLNVTAGDGAPVPETVADTIRTVPGVRLAVPVVSSSAFSTDGSGEQLAVHGIDVANDDAIRTYEPADSSPELDDPIVFLNNRDSVILTTTFAARHGLALDAPIELDTPTGRHRFVVRGLLNPKGIAQVQGGNVVVMDIDAAERIFTQPGLVSRIDLVTDADADLSKVREAVLAALPTGLRVEAPEARRVDLQRVMRSVQTMLEAVGVFGLFAAFLIAYSRLSTVFEDRVGQLAILRAVGVRKGRVWRELLKESALVAVAGVALGIPIGIAFGRAVLPIIATTTALGANLVMTDAVMTVRPQSIALAALLGIAAVVCAAMVPARRASRVAIVDVLQHRRTDPEDGIAMRPVRWTLAAVAAGLIAAHVTSGLASLGLMASAVIVIATASLTRPLLAMLSRPMAIVGPYLGGAVGHFAVGNLLRLPRRTSLTVATIGIGLGTVLWLWTLARSFEQSVLEIMPGVLRGDFAVSSANIGTGYVEAPLDQTVVTELQAIGGVSGVIGEQTANWHYGDGPIAINAFDPDYFRTTTFGTWRLIGPAAPDAMDRVARGGAVLVSENFEHNLGHGVGDRLTLDTPSGPLDVDVVGVIADFLSPRGTILMSRDVYRRLWRDTHLTHALVKIAAGTDEPVRATIERTLGERHRIRVLRIHELVDWFADQVRRAFAGLNVLAGLVIVVVLIGIGDALAAGTMERRREFGVARAVGVRRRAIGQMVVCEAVLLGLMGIVVAIVLGLGLGILWVKWTFPALLGWTLSLYLPLAQAGELALAAIGISLLAAYVPTVRAVRLDPVAALRAE